MRMRGGHFWQLGSIASLATETIILVVSFCPKYDLRSDLKVPNSKKLVLALQSQIKVLKV